MHNSIDWIKTTPIAHRGIYDNITVAENSKTSIQKAIDANYAIELDVNLTKDNTPIVFHDNIFSRMTDSDGYVNLTEYKDIKNEKLLKSDDVVLTVADAIKLVDGKVPILFNISGELPLSVSKHFYEAVKDYTGEFAVESTNPYTLEWFKINAPRVKRGQRSGAFNHRKPEFAKRGQLRKLKLNHISEPNFVVYRIEDAKKRYFKKLKKNGTPLILGTIRTKKEARKFETFDANQIVYLEK